MTDLAAPIRSHVPTKLVAAVPVLCAAALLTACSGDGSTGATTSTVSAAWRKVAEVPVPHGPAPKKLVVKQLKSGSGPRVKRGQIVKVRYVNVDYKTGEAFEDHWSPPEPLDFNYGIGEVLGAWETGMKGMRVGDRRELFVPSNLSYGGIPQIYVIELLGLKARAR